MRNTVITVLAILFISILLGACSSNKSRVKIDGNISGEEVSFITLSELDVYESKELKKQKLRRSGDFSFETPCEATSLYLITTESDDYVVLVVNPGDEINITAEGSDVTGSYKVSGSKESELLKVYRTVYHQRRNKLSEINNMLIQSRSKDNYAEIHASLTAQMEQIVYEQKMDAEEFIRKHPESLVSLLVFNDRMGQQQLFDETEDLALMAILDKGLSKAYPDNKHSLAHHERYEKAKKQQDFNSQ